ncbi:MAG TPA: S8 family serine peptidase [Bryobacteraceae bacterium]|nr:S8 family serine peptidase [Bryobacteraceae bacterium]
MKRWWVLLAGLSLLEGEVIPNRYIVEMSEEPVAAVAVRAARRGQRISLQDGTARKQRDRVRAAQQALRRQVAALDGAVLSSVETVANALLVRIPDARAATLAQAPGVLKVHPVRAFRLHLDHALPLHKVPDAWSLVGVDQAGRGMKIAFIDTGIDINHPGLQDPSLPVPDGFPKVNADSDKAFTNQKVIVARSYAAMFVKPDPDTSALDHSGHGTATAMAAAGVQNTGPLAVISGVAPKAYVGSYKVFGSPGVNDNAPEDAILKAIDDAVSDGMDVINLSLGTDIAPRPIDDLEVQVIERAAAAGVLVVVSAGNNGPDPMTISSPATAPSAIAVGASNNDRVFATSVTITGGGPYLAIPSSGPAPSAPVTAPLVDVSSLGNDGMACSALPDSSLSGSIALILRGVCLFEDKLNNAQKAGAVGALVYTDQERPDPIIMSVGSASLPAEMVSYSNGLEIKKLAGSALQATLSFTLGPLWVDPNRLAGFSARGPDTNGAIKPDLVAVGANLYTAAQKNDPVGDLYDANGYVVEQGTSFSAPLVSGAAALLKAARPGLTAAQYRSLLINSAAPAWLDSATPARVAEAGAGLLDVSAAIRSTAAIAPASLYFGAGGPDVSATQNLSITNLGSAAETFQLSVAPRDNGPAPALPTASIQLDPGASASMTLTFSAASLPPGQYEGFVTVQGTNSGVLSRLPYLYEAGSGTPQYLTVLHTASDLKAGGQASNAIIFRITDAAGLPLTSVEPTVSALSGSGRVTRVRNLDSASPGVFGVSVMLGALPGANVFRIQAGALTRDVALTGN